MLEDHITLILGQQMTLFVYPETQNGGTTWMEQMGVELISMERNTRQVDCLASGIIFGNTMFHVSCVWSVADLL